MGLKFGESFLSFQILRFVLNLTKHFFYHVTFYCLSYPYTKNILKNYHWTWLEIYRCLYSSNNNNNNTILFHLPPHSSDPLPDPTRPTSLICDVNITIPNETVDGPPSRRHVEIRSDVAFGETICFIIYNVARAPTENSSRSSALGATRSVNDHT